MSMLYDVIITCMKNNKVFYNKSHPDYLDTKKKNEILVKIADYINELEPGLELTGKSKFSALYKCITNKYRSEYLLYAMFT